MDVTVIEQGSELHFSGTLEEWRSVRLDMEHERDMTELHKRAQSPWGRLRRAWQLWRSRRAQAKGVDNGT